MSLKSEINIFFKAGYDNKSLGACYQSQRVLMVTQIKYTARLMPEFESTPVNISKPPDVFKELGLHLRVPALHLKIKSQDVEPLDIPDEIVSEIDNRYPGGFLKNELEGEAETATRDFFSKFCHWMRGVAKDSAQLETELSHVDSHLAAVSDQFPDAEKLFLCGEQLAMIDCEVLPKLHQVRVAAHGIKEFEIPHQLTYLWRYLHSAYSEPAFINSCPSDTEILLHWLDTGSARLSPRQQQLLASSSGKPPSYSFSVPATAVRAVIE